MPVPADRLAALGQSGSAVIGLASGYRHVAGFVASVFSELRGVLGLPGTHGCVVVPVVPGAVLELAMADLGSAVPVVARENPHWPYAVGAGDPWRVVDLTRTTAPMAPGVLGGVDVAFFCASWVFGLPAGLTVVTLSPRAVAAARPTGLGALFTPAPTVTDLVLLAHAVRDAADREPGALERAARARLALVRDWAVDKPWVAEPPLRVGGDLVARVRVSAPARAVAEIGEFLAAHHLAYGVTDPAVPGTLLIGLGETVPIDDLERLLGLLAFLFDAVAG
ncbi:hypothetical protein SAMN05216174_110150 [Actinokineospora iranica]|uniref:Uncharacterized protein n=2 Tax=Actinokineospora iranica TaxID=1271860 RepID=A0A1G6U7U7_9PSEU|nr:hypothetical protein SAMN05216174_110150 [Actinokineospora iranica]